MEEAPPSLELLYDDGGSRLPFARGGPIYVPGLVGAPTSVPDFRPAVLSDLDTLCALLSPVDDHDLSVDELKVFTEEELVEMALREASMDGSCVSAMLTEDFEGMPDQPSTSRKETVCSEFSAVDVCSLPSSNSPISTSIEMSNADSSEKKIEQRKKKKRGRTFDRNNRAAELEGSYFARVKQLAKIKQKQDEDELAARLHSFSGSSKSLVSAISTSEKIERIRSLRFITSPVKMKPSNSQEHVPLCYQEVVLCVEIYHKKSTSQKTQEFLVLGSQPLTDLRDNIYCLTDKLMQTAEQHDPSGYFLIEDTFYNDLRHPSATDYTKPIFEWLRNCKNEMEEKWKHLMFGELKTKQKALLGDVETPNLPNFKVADMHRTHFSDLRFRLGAGYLYCHQGNCKHIIVIRDMRLIHQEDVQNQADYPLLTFQLRPRYRKCSLCKIYHATKMTVDDKWAPKNPCYFCIKCYFLLHYKEDNTLLYPHAVFDYFHE